MNTTVKLFASVLFASACPTSSISMVCGHNNLQTVRPMPIKDFTNKFITPINTYTAFFPNRYFSAFPPKKNYSEAFKKMRRSKTLNVIYNNASIGDVISVE